MTQYVPMIFECQITFVRVHTYSHLVLKLWVHNEDLPTVVADQYAASQLPGWICHSWVHTGAERCA